MWLMVYKQSIVFMRSIAILGKPFYIFQIISSFVMACSKLRLVLYRFFVPSSLFPFLELNYLSGILLRGLVIVYYRKTSQGDE